jgi:hypothetical protein
MVGGRFLPRLESGLLCFHIVGFFGIMIPLVIKAHHKLEDQVFEEFLNGGNFPNQGLSWFVGLSGAAFAFGGGDAAVHVSRRSNVTVLNKYQLKLIDGRGMFKCSGGNSESDDADGRDQRLSWIRDAFDHVIL